jgi:hypothetical protein
MSADRIPCCVPFCRRTAPRTGKFDRCTKIICGKHWRLARRSRRLTYGRLLLEIDRDTRPFWHMTHGSAQRLRRIKVEKVAAALWRRLEAETIERAMGITA